MPIVPRPTADKSQMFVGVSGFFLNSVERVQLRSDPMWSCRRKELSSFFFIGLVYYIYVSGTVYNKSCTIYQIWFLHPWSLEHHISLQIPECCLNGFICFIMKCILCIIVSCNNTCSAPWNAKMRTALQNIYLYCIYFSSNIPRKLQFGG